MSLLVTAHRGCLMQLQRPTLKFMFSLSSWVLDTPLFRLPRLAMPTVQFLSYLAMFHSCQLEL
jgi:hypothetical protein